MKNILITLLILSALLGAGYLYMTKGGGAVDVELVRVEKLRFKNFSPFPNPKLTVEANAIINNPNAFGVDITAVDFDVYIEGKHTTRINQDVSVTMPANDEFSMPIKFDIPLGKSGFFKDATDILTGAWKNKSVKIKSEGTITIRALKIDLELPFAQEDSYLLKDYLPG